MHLDFRLDAAEVQVSIARHRVRMLLSSESWATKENLDKREILLRPKLLHSAVIQCFYK